MRRRLIREYLDFWAATRSVNRPDVWFGWMAALRHDVVRAGRYYTSYDGGDYATFYAGG